MPEGTGGRPKFALHIRQADHTMPEPFTERRQAIFGFRLVGKHATAHHELVCKTQRLLVQFDDPAPTLGLLRALDLRYFVEPRACTRDGHTTVSVSLLGRVSVSAEITDDFLREYAVKYQTDLSDALAHTLPGFEWVTFRRRHDVLDALAPMKIRDTGEVRRHMWPYSMPHLGAVAPLLPMPLLGTLEIDRLLHLLQGQQHPVLLSCAFQPVPAAAVLHALNGMLDSPPSGGTAGAGPTPGNSRTRNAAPEEDPPTPEVQFAYVRGLQDAQVTALRMGACLMRVQAASSHPLGNAFIQALTTSIGTASTCGDGASGENHPGASSPGAMWVRPRNARNSSALATELEQAVYNAYAAECFPWGHELLPPDGTVLAAAAPLREAARQFALPHSGELLPSQQTALQLPFEARGEEGVRLGHNDATGRRVPIYLPQTDRFKHLWVVGQTGTGKSNLLASMILQDFAERRSVIVIDPHGDLVKQIAMSVPAKRVRDVIYVDPADVEYPVGLNIIEAHSEEERALVSSSFLELLTRLYDPHHQGITGPRFEHNSRNLLHTAMSIPGGGTLIEVVRMMQDMAFVRTILPHVTDPLVRRYWTDQIKNTNDFHRSEVLDWVVSKFGHYVTDPTMRRIIGQTRSGFSFRRAMGEGKMILISLAKGRLGDGNATFLGLNLLPMILHAALSRVDLPEAARRDVTLYVDEFHNYHSNSLAQMLAEARKYRLALVLANQHIHQLEAHVREAVVGNVGSHIAMRVGAADAPAMAQLLAPSPVMPEHAQGLPNYTGYARLLLNGQHSRVFTLQTELVKARFREARYEAVRAYSRARYARPRAEVDEEITQRAGL